MADTSLISSSEALDMVLGGAPDELVTQVSEALAGYAAASKGPMEEIMKAAKLRGAFTTITDWLLAKRLAGGLNDAQWIFLSTGALGATVEVEHGAGTVKVDLLPAPIYEWLQKQRAAKATRPPWAVTLLDVEDRINAIGRGELVGLDAPPARRKKPPRQFGSDQLKEKTAIRLGAIANELKNAVAGVEQQLTAYGILRDEKIFTNARMNTEAVKKYAQLAAAPGTRTDQELKLMSTVGDKLSALTQSIAGVGNQLEKTGRELAARAQVLEGKASEFRACREDLDRLAAGGTAGEAEIDFTGDIIAAVRRDTDTIAQFVVKASESADNKVTFSGSRILVKEQWKDYAGAPDEYIATIPSVVAAIERISKLHVNVFPRQADGTLIIPPILIEPIRNFIEYFDDRLVMSLVSGELPRKGAKLSLNPLEVQVMKACGHYLAKDSMYDYRGEINVGTFMGDYSGKVEKTTSVKWTGADKKMTMAMSSAVVDGASRAEAVNDYLDSLFAFANGMTPPPKLSRRKLAILLRYVLVESVERTVGLTLMHVAQAELNEAKETIHKWGKNDEGAKALVIKAFEDPQVGKVCGDRDFFVTKLFGKA